MIKLISIILIIFHRHFLKIQSKPLVSLGLSLCFNLVLRKAKTMKKTQKHPLDQTFIVSGN